MVRVRSNFRPHKTTRLLIRGSWLIFASLVWLVPSHAGNMYVFKDNNGRVLLTNVVENDRPVGTGFSQFTQKVKVTYYADTNVHTYHNWGATEAAVPASGSKNRNAYDAMIVAAATRHGVDPALMKAVMHTESGFNPAARSPVGAQGLMQLMPATARRFGVANAWNPADNIEGAAKYLKYLNRRFGNIEHVLAGYNAGEGNVTKYGGVPPFRETRDYVKRVLSRYNNLYRNDPTLRAGVGQTLSYSSTTTTYGNF
ncbi:lytic transglycosylase domain-containing protein [Faucicola atlantae]|uniref:lytic transglycosylase domain-containing protein n=1 Tax=Faucicola atlantae TaxID=34059 RepID=UPI0009F44310|nr:lytic transglycosylase domain-containing protein [Moraxella atlantae]